MSNKIQKIKIIRACVHSFYPQKFKSDQLSNDVYLFIEIGRYLFINRDRR